MRKLNNYLISLVNLFGIATVFAIRLEQRHQLPARFTRGLHKLGVVEVDRLRAL